MRFAVANPILPWRRPVFGSAGPCAVDSGPQDSRETSRKKVVSLESSSALNEVNNQDDDGSYEQEMDQTTANVAKEAKKPEHDEDNDYSPKHEYSFRLS